MRAEGWFSMFFFVIGTLAIVTGIKNVEPMLVALGSILWVGSLFFEVMMIKQDVREFYKWMEKCRR